MIGDAPITELNTYLRSEYSEETERKMKAILDRMEYRANVSARLMLLWLCVTSVACAVLILADRPFIGVCMLMTNMISVLITDHFRTIYESYRGLHDWIQTDLALRGFEDD